MPSVVAEDYKLISSPNRSLIKDPRSPILIIGAGVVGLVLAQALKKVFIFPEISVQSAN